MIFQNFYSLWPETNWDNEDMWVLKVKVILWPWSKVIYIWKLKLLFSEMIGPFWTKFYFVLGPKYQVSVSQDHWSSGICKLIGSRKRKFIDMMLVTWPKWLPRPYMVKTFKNLPLWNRWTDFHKTWNVALVTPVHHNLFKWWPWVDLDQFYGKIKFGN